MVTFKRSVVVDVDGTGYSNFSEDDKKIISKLFEKSAFVKALDKLLWNINSLDFIPNSMTLLNLRLRLYSLLSFGLSYEKYIEIREEYKVRYQNLLAANLNGKAEVFKKISDEYNIIFVTNNEYAVDVLQRKQDCEFIYAENFFSRKKQIEEKSYTNSISYIIGNNFTDDILLAKKLHLRSIYVGKSIFSVFFGAEYNVSSIDGVIKIL